MLSNLWIGSKNIASLRGNYLQNRSVLPCAVFVLIKLIIWRVQLQSNSVINFDQLF